MPAISTGALCWQASHVAITLDMPRPRSHEIRMGSISFPSASRARRDITTFCYPMRYPGEIQLVAVSGIFRLSL